MIAAAAVSPLVLGAVFVCVFSIMSAALIACVFKLMSLKADLACALETLELAESALTPPFVKAETNSARHAVRTALNLMRDGAP